MMPLMMLIVLAIKVESPGPCLFRQSRFGLHNRPFTILKFRTMRSSAPEAEGGRLIQTNRTDARVTRVGRVLRATSLDELPQLFNVLAGDMSIVGPRPHAVNMMIGESPYHELFPHYGLRHVVRPGLTGLAQVSGNRGIVDSVEKARDRLDQDLAYIESMSLASDLAIMAKTVLVVLRCEAF